MLFVPGAAITNALRDLINGDTLLGVARTAEAIAVAISLASGVGSVLKLWSYLMELRVLAGGLECDVSERSGPSCSATLAARRW